MKSQYITAAIALAFLSACAAQHDTTMAKRLTAAQRAILRGQQNNAHPATKGTLSSNPNTSSQQLNTLTVTAEKYCRLTTNLPKVNGQVVDQQQQQEPICDSATVTINKAGEIQLPSSNDIYVKDTNLGLLPTAFSQNNNVATFTFQSTTAKTNQLVLAYILPGVDPNNLSQEMVSKMNITYKPIEGSANVQAKPLTQGMFQLESMPSAQAKGQALTVVHIIDPADAIPSADYALTIQVPSQFVSNAAAATAAVNSSKTQPQYSMTALTLIKSAK